MENQSLFYLSTLLQYNNFYLEKHLDNLDTLKDNVEVLNTIFIQSMYNDDTKDIVFCLKEFIDNEANTITSILNDNI